MFSEGNRMETTCKYEINQCFLKEEFEHLLKELKKMYGHWIIQYINIIATIHLEYTVISK